MADRRLAVLVEGGAFFESPRWHEGRWWVSDFYRHRVLTVDGDGRSEEVVEVEGQPSGLGWMPDGSLLVVSMRDRRILRRSADGAVAVHAEVGEYCGGHLNDMVVDRHGRAYVGNFGFDLMAFGEPAPAPLVRVDPDGTVTVVAEDLRFPNGAVFLADGTLVLSETLGNRVSAFDVAPDGSLSARRDWARFGEPPAGADVPAVLGEIVVAPDGMGGPDAEGAVWIADALNNRVLRVRESETLDEVSTGDVGVYACALGGPDGRTLYLCTAPGFAEHERRDTRDARLQAVTVEVPAA